MHSTTYTYLIEHAHNSLEKRGVALGREYMLTNPITRYALSRKFKEAKITKKVITKHKYIPIQSQKIQESQFL